ncbi:MAG: RES family NAD+ phosphorylase [Polaromonas sp.]
MTVGLDPSNVAVKSMSRSLWWRVHAEHFGTIGYNGSDIGNARFSPIRDVNDAIIPTLYAGTSPSVALMETVLHDAPWPSSGYILTLPAPENELRRMSCLVNMQTLQLADFSALGLRRLGLKKSKVIESDKTHYPFCRKVAEWVYKTRPDLHGIVWPSRQDDRGLAMVLFEPRLIATSLRVWHDGENIAGGYALEVLVELLDVLGAGMICG